MDLLKLLKQKKALLEGHFLLSSGLHSDKYIQCAKVLQYPKIAEQLAKLLVTKLSTDCDVVVSPAIGGIVIGQEVARQLNCRAIFCERENGVMKFRRGFEIKKNEKCLIVEDVITTGGSTKEVIDIVKSCGGKVVGIASIIDRSELKNFSVSLLKLKIKTYNTKQCL
ncbi:MAG: orotate phosphoribosyltransferase [Elusimicrobia bacterium]|nr:orotate phosphoribosyltransferase [Elusimicrobiota bacterium]